MVSALFTITLFKVMAVLELISHVVAPLEVSVSAPNKLTLSIFLKFVTGVVVFKTRKSPALLPVIVSSALYAALVVIRLVPPIPPIPPSIAVPIAVFAFRLKVSSTLPPISLLILLKLYDTAGATTSSLTVPVPSPVNAQLLFWFNPVKVWLSPVAIKLSIPLNSVTTPVTERLVNTQAAPSAATLSDSPAAPLIVPMLPPSLITKVSAAKPPVSFWIPLNVER